MSQHFSSLEPNFDDGERTLLAKILLVLISGGGGGMGGIQGQSGDYSGSQPSWTPTGTNIGVAIDTSNNRVWWYFNSTWQ